MQEEERVVNGNFPWSWIMPRWLLNHSNLRKGNALYMFRHRMKTQPHIHKSGRHTDH